MDSYILYAVYFLIAFLANDVESLRFFLQPNVKKCMKEEIRKNVVVTGEYEISEAYGHKTSIFVSILAPG